MDPQLERFLTSACPPDRPICLIDDELAVLSPPQDSAAHESVN
jgi:hypothetical protein